MKVSYVKTLAALVLALACGTGRLGAQTLNEAKALFQEGKYEEAMPAFAKFVKSAPSNGSYNHWYGVCLFETGDLKGAEKYLKTGVRRRVQESYRYLGELYLKTYRFDEAIEMFEDYVDLLAKKKADTALGEARLGIAEEGSRMLSKVEKVQVIDSVVVDKDEILNAYTLSEECGKLAAYQDFFQGVADTTSSSVFMNQKGSLIYYARPAEEGRYRLFSQSRLMDTWGDEKLLDVNTDGDENYPFILPDGATVYFASNGSESLGGYDLYITRYNTGSGTYLNPERLGMPYNSPYNDYMMVLDEVKGLGWFVSDRFQPEGKVCVYLFIPNESRERVETEDLDEKRAWASLASIRVTQDSLANYREQVALAHKVIPYGQKRIEQDFVFPIDDQTVYYKIEDIRSPEARSLYQKVINLNRQIKELRESLDERRMAYASGNEAKKESLSDGILADEQLLEELLGQPAGLEKAARNAEINYLKQNRR